MPDFARVEIWTHYPMQAQATRLAAVASLLRCDGAEGLAAGFSLEFDCPLSDPCVTHLLERRVVCAVFSDGSYVPYRISKIRGLRGEQGNTVTVTAQSPLLDLADGPVTETTGTVTRYDIGLIDVTATQVMDTYIIPRAASFGQTYWERGTVEPTALISPTFNAKTPLEWLRGLQDLLRDPETLRPAEVRVRVNGAGTKLAIDILTEIGADVAISDIRYRKNLRTTDRTRDTAPQATVVTPLGDPFPNGTTSGITQAAWRLTGAHPDWTITDPEGGPSPILADGFGDGWYVDPGANLTPLEITSIAVGPPSIITLADSTGIVSGGVYELRDTLLGIYITALTDETNFALYGGKHAFVNAPGVVGIRNLVTNPFFKTWTTPTNAPDGWSVFAGLPFSDYMTQETSAALTHDGGNSVKFAQTSEIGPVFGIVSPTIYPAAVAGDNMCSVKVRVWFEIFTGGVEFQVQIRPTGGGDLIYGITLHPPNDPLFTEGTNDRPATGTWVDVIIQDMDLTAWNAGVQVHVRAGAGYGFGPAYAGQIEAYVAAVQFARHGGPVPPGYYEYSGANAIWHAGIRALRANGAPLTRYELDVDDLTRYDDTAFPFDAFTLGATVRLTDADLTISGDLVRIVGVPLRNLLFPKRTRLQVATRAELLAEYLNSQPPNNAPPGTSPPPPNNPPTQPPTTAPGSLNGLITLHATPPLIVRAVPSAAIEPEAAIPARFYANTAQWAGARMQLGSHLAAGEGVEVPLLYSLDAGATWDEAGPTVSAALVQFPAVGAFAGLVADARATSVLLTWGTKGGDGDTTVIKAGNIYLEPSRLANPPDAPDPEPPTGIPETPTPILDLNAFTLRDVFALANGADVTAWRDDTGNVADATQGAGSFSQVPPVFLTAGFPGSLPCVRVSPVLEGFSCEPPTRQACTYYFVVADLTGEGTNGDSGPMNAFLIRSNLTTGGSNFWISARADGLLQACVNNSVFAHNARTGVADVSGTGPHLIVFTWNNSSGTFQVFVDDMATPDITRTHATVNASWVLINRLYFGNIVTHGLQLGMKYGRVLCYAGAHDLTTRNAIKTALDAQWGLP